MPLSALAGLETRFLGPRRTAHQFDPARPLRVLARRDGDVTVAARQHPAHRNDRGCGLRILAVRHNPRRRWLVEGAVGQGADQLRDHGFKRRHLDMTTRAGQPAAVQGHQGRRGRGQTGREFGLMPAGANRRQRVAVRHRPQHTGCLAAHVEQNQIRCLEMFVGTPRAERGDGGEDQAGVVLSQRLVVQLRPGEPAMRKVLDDDGGGTRQVSEPLPVFRQRQVQGDAVLVQVQRQKQAALLGVRQLTRKRPGTPRCIACGRLQLDDLGAHEGQYLAAIGRADPPTKFQHPDTGQQPLRHLVPPQPDEWNRLLTRKV